MKQIFYRITPILIGFLCLFTTPAQAQNNTIDSLIVKLHTANQDTNKVNILIGLATAHYPEDLAAVKKYGEESLRLANSLGFKRGVGAANFILAKVYNKLNQPQKAVSSYNEALNLYRELKDDFQVARIYNNVGIIYKNQGQHLKALEVYKLAHLNYTKVNDLEGASKALANMGSLSIRLGNHKKAAEHLFKALQVFDSLGEMSQVAYVNGSIGNLYIEQKNYERALKYQNKAEQIFRDLGSKSGTAQVLNNTGLIYKEQDLYDSALITFKEAFNIFEELNAKQGMGIALSNIGTVYVKKEEYASSLEYYQKALNIFQEIDFKSNIANVYNGIGLVYMKLRRFDDSHNSLQKGLELSIIIGEKQKEMDSYERLYELYEVQNKFEQAYEYHKLYASIKDSILNQSKSRQIAQIETNFEINQREQDIKILKQQKAIQEATIKRKNLIVTFASIGVLGLLLFALYLYRVIEQKKKTNLLLSHQNQEINLKQQQIITINKNLQQSQDQLHVANKELQSVNARLETTVKKRTSELQKTNQELDTFLYQSSHALRRPIVHVKGLVQLARLEPNQDEVIGLYDKLDDTATRMDLMLKKLVMASEIYVTKPEVDAIKFEEIFKDIWQSLSESLKSENVSLEYTIPNDLVYEADGRLVKIMFLNLLENAVLYNEATKQKKAVVNITVTNNLNSIDIKVNDNGIGITQEAINHIFDLFTVGTDQTKGYGLGLYIVKKAVEKLQGLITVSSKRNQFTTFHITLPKNLDIS